jgi:urea transport system substrate-binding protein
MSKLGRRRFLLFGSATLGTSLLLKACGSAPTSQTQSQGGQSSTPSTPESSAPASGGGDTIKVGILHSLSGTMAISETTVVEAEKLAI